MHNGEQNIIKILCKKLPGDVSRAVYNEYNSRWSEIEQVWNYPQNRYKLLQKHESTIQLLLAMSTFYRRVLNGFDGARDFYKTVSNNSGTKTEFAICIGQFKLNFKQYCKLQAVQISFCKLKDKFGISNSFFKYNETYEFLNNCMYLYNCDVTPNDGRQENLPF